MDSATIIFIISVIILQNTLDCNGISLRDQLERLRINRRGPDYSDDFQMTQSFLKPHPGMWSKNIGPSMSNEWTEVEAIPSALVILKPAAEFPYEDLDSEPEVYGNISPLQREYSRPRCIIAIVRSSNEDIPVLKKYYKLQNDRRAQGLMDYKSSHSIRKNHHSEPEQTTDLLDVPIAHYIKDYRKIEDEISKREKEYKTDMTRLQISVERHSLEPEHQTSSIAKDSQIAQLVNSYSRFNLETMKKKNEFDVGADILGQKISEEKYNLEPAMSSNLADMSLEHLIVNYHRLEQEIMRRKQKIEEMLNVQRFENDKKTRSGIISLENNKKQDFSAQDLGSSFKLAELYEDRNNHDKNDYYNKRSGKFIPDFLRGIKSYARRK